MPMIIGLKLSPNNKEIYKIFKKHRSEWNKYSRCKNLETINRRYPSTYVLTISDIYKLADAVNMSEKDVEVSLTYLTDLGAISYNKKEQFYVYDENFVYVSSKELEKIRQDY